MPTDSRGAGGALVRTCARRVCSRDTRRTRLEDARAPRGKESASSSPIAPSLASPPSLAWTSSVPLSSRIVTPLSSPPSPARSPVCSSSRGGATHLRRLSLLFLPSRTDFRGLYKEPVEAETVIATTARGSKEWYSGLGAPPHPSWTCPTSRSSAKARPPREADLPRSGRDDATRTHAWSTRAHAYAWGLCANYTESRHARREGGPV